MKRLSTAILCATLVACGGSSSNDSPRSDPGSGIGPGPVITPGPAVLAQSPYILSSRTLRTLAGGPPITIKASGLGTGPATWKLGDGAPGTLSASTGDTVTYTPPAGGIASPTLVPVTVTQDGYSATLTLAVTPDPGTPGLTTLSWRKPAEQHEPTLLNPVAFAADAAGNVYVMLLVTSNPEFSGGPSFVKIAPDGSVSDLNVYGAYGTPASNANRQRVYYSRSFAVDRQGNMYIPSAPNIGELRAGQQTSTGRAILKVTPAGEFSVLAGSEGPQVGAMTDGFGDKARFLNPKIVGIDNDDNVYLLDNDVPRMVDRAGLVTTIAQFPTSLNADLNGNTYRYDETAGQLVRTTPDGVTSAFTGVPTCTASAPVKPDTCLDGHVSWIIPLSGASYVIVGNEIQRLVIPH